MTKAFDIVEYVRDAYVRHSELDIAVAAGCSCPWCAATDLERAMALVLAKEQP